MQFIVKVSKLCNLRCRYCYEYPELGNRKRISRAELAQMYRNVASWLAGPAAPQEVEFVWHGGEPLLSEPRYYWQTLDDQRAVFGDGPRVIRNVVQTNLTVLDDERVRLLRDGFDAVGVSLDLFGALRVDGRGVDSVERVLRNVDRLRASGVRFGCITVLTKSNLNRVREIVRFYDELRVSSLRLLPLIDGAFLEQHDGYEITREQVLAALIEAFETLITRESTLPVEPLNRYIEQVLYGRAPRAPKRIHDKRRWEPVLFVDTSGDVYGYGDLYQVEARYGNLFRQPLDEILASAEHDRACALAERRMAATCGACRFLGSCDGYPIAEGAGRRARDGRADECVVELGMLTYLERRLAELGMLPAGRECDAASDSVRAP